MSDNPEPDGRAVGDSPTARIPRDALAGAVVLAFCLAVYVASLWIEDAPPALAQNVQPATFPRLVLAVMAVLATVIIVNSFRLPDSRVKPIHFMVWPSAGVMVGFVTAFYFIGILPAMMLLCFGLPLIWGERRLYLIIPYAIAFPSAIYLLFAVVLRVHFEPSPLVFW